MFTTLRQRLEDRLCPRSKRKSFSLDRLDSKIEKHLRFRRGFFVEAGANDGIRQSNTLYFEKYLGWRGLLIEPVPELASRCRANRPACRVENCALVSSAFGETEIEVCYCDLMTVVTGGMEDPAAEARHLDLGQQFLKKGDSSRTLKVPAKTLSRVLDENGIDHVDLLSLDVEGYESEALKGIDFRRHKPQFMLIEVRDATAIMSVLSPWYQRICTLSQHDEYEDVLFAREDR